MVKIIKFLLPHTFRFRDTSTIDFFNERKSTRGNFYKIIFFVYFQTLDITS